MGKGIYTYYKERLIEIGGNNKCLYLKSIARKSAYDLGKIFEGRDAKVAEFVQFLHSTKKYPLTLISSGEKKEILQNLEIQSKKLDTLTEQPAPIGEEADKLAKKIERERKSAQARAFESEISKLKDLKREIEEIEKETGRYELYVGYPFVFGTISQGFNKTLIKAPLMLFPVKIVIPDENTVEISFNEAEKIRINPALVFAYAQAKRINVDTLELEFDDASNFGGVGDVVKYLNDNHVKIDWTHSKNVFGYSRFKEPTEKELSVRYAAVLGRFPLSNSIYNDYSLLEKKKLTNEAVNELLRTGKQKKAKKQGKPRAKKQNTYATKMLDYAQSQVLEKVDEKGNMVIYGPPGTGKSQTIVNIISDAVCKNKRVLVVSQKKAALDVVYNRLGLLNSKAMYINDECKQKRHFYDRCLAAHQENMLESLADVAYLENEYNALQQKIDHEEKSLDTIYNVLNQVRPFGLSLSDMYASSSMLSKTSTEYGIYTKLCENTEIMAFDYNELSEALFVIKAKNLEKLYYNFIQDKEKNPLIDHMQPEIDIHTLSEVKGALLEIQKSRKGFFNTAKYPYYRQVMAYYKELAIEKNLDLVVKQECRFRYPGKIFTKKLELDMKERFIETLEAVDSFVKEYDCLHRVLSVDGYISVIDNILRGNVSYIKLVYDALDNYIALRDVNKLIESLEGSKIAILNFAYSISKSYANYAFIIDKIMELRIYHEIIHYEDVCKDELAKMVDFPNITARIYKLKEQQLEVAAKLACGKNSCKYEELYNNAKNNKDYLYQISKKQKYWPIRKTMDVYGDFILSLFPCWLLSPENVSSLLPLNRNMFDLVIFDEASQVFIESTIPAIYRGKNIVVAGDSKQLRPSTTFMKRYLGGDHENLDDYAVQAALELAVARYESANLTYHYRSRNSELIEFSNSAFYSSGLRIAPNISKNVGQRPIERYKVCGKWVDRKNPVEAKQIVAILKEIFATRKNNESIGIITFNTEQQSCIADCIDKEAAKDHAFRSDILKESRRIEAGEDTSIFIKNLENVQGDERDIIIFSIGYAENADGKVYTNFGSLSAEGGENRLNVAITRAKNKVIVVTSIEPEALKVETSKHQGPKLLKKYLTYARAVSSGDGADVSAILSGLDSSDGAKKDTKLITGIPSVEEQMKEKLVKLGYTVDINLGNEKNRISLAIYDEKKDKYLVGVELDKDAYAASSSTIERDVYKPRFFESRGWTIIRVWCRDWWLYPQKVIKSITAAAEKNRQKK